MNTLVKIVGLLALVAVCFGDDLFDCATKFTKPTEDKEHKDNIEKCHKELNLGDQKAAGGPSSEEEFIASNYDDKCITKCTLEKMKLMEGDKLNRAAILKDADNMILDKKDEKFVAKIAEITGKCIDEAEKLSKPTPCAQASYFGFCVGKAQEKICMPPKAM